MNTLLTFFKIVLVILILFYIWEQIDSKNPCHRLYTGHQTCSPYTGKN